MPSENSTPTSKICPTCGTRVSEDATRCLVCGSVLVPGDETETKAAKAVRGSRMPEVILSLPVAIGLLALFLTIGAVLVFVALQETDHIVIPTETPTVTLTITPSITPTPVTPTATATQVPTPTPFTYTVAEGDTCLAIAARFEVSVQSIVLLNSLPAACNTLFPNQQLLIPYPTPTATPFPTATLSGFEATIAACEKVYYEVQETDTLSDIATNYNVPMDAIREYNGMPNNTVFAGITLIIPLCERAATPGPSPTPTPPPPYAAPSLLLPADGSIFTIENQVVTLQWAAVGILNPNEAYQVTVEDITEGQGRKLVDQVTDTKFLVPASFRASESTPHIYRWTVMTVRQTGTDESGNIIWDTAGAVSNSRVFTWMSTAGVPSPTP
jgi:LysM repeat protein